MILSNLYIDSFVDSILDVIKIIPFLFVAFLIIELIEHKLSKKSKKIIENNKKMGPIFGGLLGAIPQCGFSVLATNLYVTRIITLGTLISIYLSTSDEMLPILISNKVSISIILKIILTKVMIGIISGIVIDLVIRKKEKENFDLCDDCDCEDSIIKSVIIHTLKTSLFIVIITFIINSLFSLYGSSLSELFINNKLLTPFLSSLMGLIPNCGSSIMITELYINGVIGYGSMLSGLLTGSGVALLILFKTNKKLCENMYILLLIYFIGVISGVLLNYM